MTTTANSNQLDNNLSKANFLRDDSYELPSFEEAFNQTYLREFFKIADLKIDDTTASDKKDTQPQENSTNDCNFGHSPYYDMMNEDMSYSAADTNDTYISPLKDFALGDNSKGRTNFTPMRTNYNTKQDHEAKQLGSSYQPFPCTLNGVNYNNISGLYNSSPSLFNNGSPQVFNSSGNQSIGESAKLKKKVFLIIRNTPPPSSTKSQRRASKPLERSTTQSYDLRSHTVEVKPQVKGQRKAKDRLKSADSIQVNPNAIESQGVDFFASSLSTDNTGKKRRASYAGGEDPQNKKKVKGQRESKEELGSAPDFDIYFDSGFFDNLPPINFDEILNKDYPVFNGNTF